MQRVLAVGIALGVLSACSSTAGPTEALIDQATGLFPAGASGETQTSTTPINDAVFVACAMGGVGEWVSLSGVIHETLHITETPKGNLHIKVQFRPQVSGQGMTSVTKYNALGVYNEMVQIAKGQNGTIVSNFRLVSQGAESNLQIHENHHLTVTPSGTVTSDGHQVSIVCGDL